MTAAPDIAGLLDALSALPDRTPAQLRAYELQSDAIRYMEPVRTADAVDEAVNDTIDEVFERIGKLKLSKAARKVIEDEFADWEIDLS